MLQLSFESVTARCIVNPVNYLFTKKLDIRYVNMELCVLSVSDRHRNCLVGRAVVTWYPLQAPRTKYGSLRGKNCSRLPILAMEFCSLRLSREESRAVL